MKSLLIANWKMNPQTLAEAKELFNLVERGVINIKKAEVVICPPFVYLLELGASASAKGYGGLAFGSQDCFWEEKGAFTGEISSLMLKNLGVKYVIIGHSERRQHLKETDEMVNKKIIAAIKTNLNPIVCIGETKEQKNRGRTSEILREQMKKALYKISAADFKKIKFSIAYEPIWAIGTGNACDLNNSKKSALLIRKIITELYDSELAKKTLILYGGSVSSENAAHYIKTAGMNGLLVGGASLRAQEFIKIVESISH